MTMYDGNREVYMATWLGRIIQATRSGRFWFLFGLAIVVRYVLGVVYGKSVQFSVGLILASFLLALMIELSLQRHYRDRKPV